MYGKVWPGIISAIKNWKTIVAVYVFQILLASIVGLQMYQVIDASIGHSLSLESLNRNYDYTVISDFLNNHGGSISPLIGQFRWMVFVYLIFSSFISAGLLFLITHGTHTYTDFFLGGARYFGRFLLVDLVFTLCILLIIGVALGITGYLFGIAPTAFPNELPFLRYTAMTFIIAILLCTILINAKNLGKIHYLRSEVRIVKSVSVGFRHFWRHKWKSLRYSAVFLSISIGLIFFNHATAIWTLWVMVIVQQSVAFFKVIWRYAFFHVLVSFEANQGSGA